MALTVPEERFPRGHETFFIVAPTTSQQSSTMELVKGRYPELTDFRREIKGNMGLFNCAKAERMLGWTEQGFEWMPDGKGGVTSG